VADFYFVPLPDCHINNVLIQFVPSCQDTWTQFIDVLHLPLVDILASLTTPCSPMKKSRLYGYQNVAGMKSGVSFVNKSTVSLSLWAALLKRAKLLTADEYLADVFSSEGLPGKKISTISFDTRLDKMDAGRQNQTGTIKDAGGRAHTQQTSCSRQYTVKAVSKAGKFNNITCSTNRIISYVVLVCQKTAW